ncbi:HNH endonuclease signature motif containing protein [Corynebacterium lubricantis]|uniref:HNH endonuclease signature motif containing protein n=1 Tax=Corynebacterium lubricantis TaxID=541095 RepID=UPI0003784CFF|nr:HNH endonuclease signature motif containing protein [Corynebacterium lubricantis]
MTALKKFANAWQDAMAILADAVGMKTIDLCQVGMDTQMAKQIHDLSLVYFGPTQATRRQAECVEAARKNQHTMHTLAVIEKLAKKIKRAKLVWKFRAEMCAEIANIRTLQALGRGLLRKYNGKEKPVNKPSLGATAISGSTYSRLTIVGPSHQIQATLDALNANSGDEHPALVALNLLNGGVAGGESAITPAVIISLGDATKIIEGDGDDVVLSLTNGTRMTGKDFVKAKLAENGLVMLVDPVAGPVNLYGTSRFPSPKQRTMCKLENPVCAAYGCGVGAEYCQVNHNVAWKNGGTTNIENLATCCSFHNGRNDDDRDKPMYGHLDRIDGQIYHVPAFGGEPLLNDNPVAQGGAMRVA